VKRTGPLLPAMTHFGPGAPSGLCRVGSDAFGAGFRDNFFATLFNLRKVTRHVLEPKGATFQTQDSDFLVSNNPDFHPTDVLEDADGSLLVIDTGAWYKLCCPTSQLAKPDVLGAIYRIRRKAAAPVADPRGLDLRWNDLSPTDLVRLLSDQRPAVVDRAVSHLGNLGEPAVEPLRLMLQEAASPEVKQSAIWALARIPSESARSAVRLALSAAEPNVRVTAAKVAGLWSDREAASELRKLLHAGPAEARAAAEALGRSGDKAAAPELFAAVEHADKDRFLEHALIFALIEIADESSAAEQLASSRSAKVRRAALTALDQMDGGTLRSEQVIPLLTDPNESLRQAAANVVSRRPEWGAAMRDFLETRLASGAQLSEAEGLLARFAGDKAVQELIAKTMSEGASEARVVALRAIAQADLQTMPESWSAEFSHVLTGDAAVLPAAVSAARAFVGKKAGAPQLHARLLALGRDAGRAAELRLEALAALPAKVVQPDGALFAFLKAQIASAGPVALRTMAATALARAQLDDGQRGEIADLMARLGAFDAGKLLPIFEAAPTEALGRRLLAALRSSPGVSGLQPQALRATLAKFPPNLERESAELLAGLSLDVAAQRAHLDKLTAELPTGDIRRGQLVFNSAKAACVACHSMGDLGGKFGPDLTSIGTVRSERDLLEAIVYPSASFVRSFEPIVARLTSGDEVMGVLRGESNDHVTVLTGPGSEQRIPRADVAELVPGVVSLMPQGLDQMLTSQELADLLAFLKATTWGAR
jgi:putative heme-binding domain-containing protein